MMVNNEPFPGGECLWRGCIPSKAWRAAADVIRNRAHDAEMGVDGTNTPKLNWEQVEKHRRWVQTQPRRNGAEGRQGHEDRRARRLRRIRRRPHAEDHPGRRRALHRQLRRRGHRHRRPRLRAADSRRAREPGDRRRGHLRHHLEPRQPAEEARHRRRRRHRRRNGADLPRLRHRGADAGTQRAHPRRNRGGNRQGPDRLAGEGNHRRHQRRHQGSERQAGRDEAALRQQGRRRIARSTATSC